MMSSAGNIQGHLALSRIPYRERRKPYRLLISTMRVGWRRVSAGMSTTGFHGKEDLSVHPKDLTVLFYSHPRHIFQVGAKRPFLDYNVRNKPTRNEGTCSGLVREKGGLGQTSEFKYTSMRSETNPLSCALLN